MSEEVREDDEWLYEGGRKEEKGEEPAAAQEEKEEELPASQEGEEEAGEGQAEVPEGKEEEKESKESADDDSDEDDDDDDDDDDGVQVVIGDTKAAVTAGQIPFGGTVGGVKRPAPAPDKKGKFAVEDFETPGTINGVSAIEYNIDGIEDKPWRKPGADITDYFNYGFTEETWRAYTERQKRMRFESGTPQIVNPQMGPKPMDGNRVITVAFGGPPGGGGPMQNQRMDMMRRREEPKENTIQVMTADRREYSRKNFEMGMGGPPMPPTFNPNIPPPNFPPPGHGPPGHGPPGPEFMNMNPDFFNHPPPQFYPDEHQGYEEQQWMDHHHPETWEMGMNGPPPSGPSTIVSLTKVPNVPPPPGDDDDKHDRKD